MKRITYILLLVLGVTYLNSCTVEDRDVDQIGDSPNIAVFEATKQSVTQIADGSTYTVQVKVKLQGPSLAGLSGDVTVNVAADESSTAVAGTHYALVNESVVLKKDNNYLALLEFTMLTDGIETPLASSPILVLKVTGASGASNVINSGKTIPVTLNYACPSDLEGWYAATMIRDGGAPVTYDDYFTKTGVGTYRTTEVGHWIGGLGVGVPGYTFMDVCSVISVPQQDLVENYSNQVQSTAPGSVDPETGVIHIIYSISSSGWTSEYDCTYVPYEK